MCYSAESSAGTFLFVAAIATFLFYRGGQGIRGRVRIAVAIILLFIALMQVVEFLIWSNIRCGPKNRLITYFIPILLFLQPIVVLASLLYFDVGLLPSAVYKASLIVWIMALPFFFWQWMKDGWGKCTVIGPNGHLEWPYTKSKSHIGQDLYNLIMAGGIGTLNTPLYGIFYIVMSSVGYFYTREIYGHSWSSIWCNFVNVLAAGAVFI
jgi:hypothetical protein